jgi:hypothetical protein
MPNNRGKNAWRVRQAFSTLALPYANLILDFEG